MTRNKGQEKLGAQNVIFTYQTLTQNIGGFYSAVQFGTMLFVLYHNARRVGAGDNGKRACNC
jgi:hypothetical protein